MLTIFAQFVAFIAFLGVGMWLVVIRPGGMTWGFYWYLMNWRAPLLLHTRQSALNGEFAFPMIARGRLIGALVLGP